MPKFDFEKKKSVLCEKIMFDSLVRNLLLFSVDTTLVNWQFSYIVKKKIVYAASFLQFNRVYVVCSTFPSPIEMMR
jgi:hypothetical protein